MLKSERRTTVACWYGLVVVAFVLATGAFPQFLWAQQTLIGECGVPDCSNACNMSFVPGSSGVPTGESCDASGVFESRCLMSQWTKFGIGSNVTDNVFSLNIDLMSAISPGDYLPLEVEPALSSSPMVSGEVQHFGGPSPFQRRTTVRGLLDPITGLPLIQEKDFELQFGAAVFRHIRTYSETPRALPGQSADVGFNSFGYGESSHWDWNGHLWMMSENPILLIDARYYDVVVPPEEKRCYFIPDSNHAIPFPWDAGLGEYAAPPWFDAELTYGGGTGALGRPLEYYLRMHRGSIKYTFEAHYEDVADIDVATGEIVSLHDRYSDHDMSDPLRGYGGGVPYYGLVKRIEDRYGNSMEYEYCTPSRWGAGCDDVSTTGCVECCQNCNEKGQIKTIKLKTADGQTAWTLVYTHRAFGLGSSLDPGGFQLHRQHALHSIHVYVGDRTVSQSCLTIPTETFHAEAGVSVDALLAIDAVQEFGLETDWVLEAKYLYDDFDQPDFPASPWRFADEVTGLSLPWVSRLLMSTVTRRANENGQIVEDQQSTMYRYVESQSALDANAGLGSIYDSSTIESILDGEELLNGTRPDPSSLLFKRNLDAVSIVDPEDPDATISVKIGELADVRMVEPEAYMSFSDKLADMIDFMGANPSRTLANISGRHIFVDRRTTSDSDAVFSVQNFVQYPAGTINDFTPGAAPGVISGYYIDNSWISHHYPFRYHDLPDTSQIISFPLSAFQEPVFSVVIDETEFETISDWKTAYSLNQFDPSTFAGIRSRRIIQLNPRGFVIRDRTWVFEEDGAELVSQFGSAVQYKYDDDGRLIEKRSRGWSTLEGTTAEDDNGLINTYTYEAEGSLNEGELKAEGVKKGVQGIVHWLRSFERGITDRPELITAEIRYPDATTALVDSSLNGIQNTHEVTVTEYELDDDPDKEAADQAVVGKTIIRPKTSIDANDASGHYAIVKTLYNDNGNMEWVGLGSVTDPTDLANTAEFYANYIKYDGSGQPVLRVDDADPSATGNPPHADLPALPAGWVRNGTGGALNLNTTYEYYPPYGLERVVYPNLREMRIAYNRLEEGLYQWTFKDLVFTEVPEEGSGDWKWVALSPVEIKLFKGGKLISQKTVRITEPFDWPDGRGEEAGENYQEVISTSTPIYDMRGRMVGVNKTGDDGASVEAGVTYNGSGQITRQQSTDGTLTRNVYDEFARLVRIYRGTDDMSEYWRSQPVCSPGQTPANDGCIAESDVADNMFLMEKRYYGTGVTDANLPIGVRSFRDTPVNAYFEVAGQNDPAIPTNNEDRVGYLTQYYYDWRMRPVWVQRNQAAVDDTPPDPFGVQPELIGDPLTHTVTWYDNLDRARFVAEYAEQGPSSSIDPRVLDPGDEVPSAALILADAVKPISLTENVLNKRGLVEEVLRYDVNDSSSYTSTQTYYGYIDKPLEVHSPGAPTMKYEYDAKGRRLTSSTFADTVEVARTKTTYDADDRAIKTVRFERKHDATTQVLNLQAAVRSHSHTWYDIAGRVIATANYGANNGTGFFWGSPPPSYDATSPPVTLDAESQVNGIDPGILTPAGGLGSVLVTGYAYDNAGRQSAVFHPDGSASFTEFDDLGRILLSTEVSPATAPDPLLKRQTAYLYDANGRLSKMAAVMPPGVADSSQVSWTATDGSVQVTEFIYGGTVVDSGGAAVSAQGGWISEVHFPDPLTGTPSATADLTLTYFSDGTVATRTDANGNVLTFIYDELGRATRIDVDDSGWYTQAAQADPKNLPDGRVQTIYLTYESDGLLQKVTTAGVVDGTSGAYIAESRFAYDDFRNLTNEWQAHLGPASTGSSPTVDYTWEFSPNTPDSYNFNRLTALTYPARPESGRRVVSFDYGDNAGGTDSRLSRITTIKDSAGTALASYEHIGTSRRLSTTLGNGVEQTFYDGTTYSGLDRFGRIADLHFTDAAGQTIHRYQYGYDLAGNRTHARVTQWPTADGTVPHDNDRSWSYQYDGLNRLLSATRGQLTADNTGIDPAGVEEASISWTLDGLGNWSGGPAPVPGFGIGSVMRSTNRSVSERQHHAVNSRNEIESVWTWSEASSAGFPDGYTRTYLQDRNGNLITDGLFVYQYDAFNRLLQVNVPGSVVFDGDGRIVSGLLGGLILRYSYDAFGRLIQKHLPLSDTDYQTEDHYYDGVRRIQTIGYRFEDPNGPGFGTGGTFGEGEGELLGFLLDPIPLPPIETTWTEREYVYGPGYVDEFVCEISPSPTAGEADDVLYFLQDANYNVVALTDENGNIAEQRVFEPYGELAAGETFGAHAVSRVGHQGLFFERIDGTVNQPPIAPGALGFYYNRNRMYSPTLGRFLQRDPNASALPIMTAMSMNGAAMDILLEGFNPSVLYGGGMNLYEYLGSNPISGRDPSGLSQDDFDDLINGLAGQNLAAIGLLNEGARIASIGLGMAMDIAGGILGVDVLQSVFVIAGGGGGFWEALDIFMTVSPIGQFAKVGGKIGKAFKLMRQGRRGSRTLGAAAEHLFKVLPYRQARKLTRGFNHKIEAHHILEVRHAKRWYINPNDVAAVILPGGKHGQFTAALRQALPYGKGYEKYEVWPVYQRVYREFPEWLQQVEKYFQ